MSETNMSEYFHKLQQEYPDVAAHYLEKIAVINSLDPFSLKDHELNSDPSCFPPISNMDIVSYLVLTKSFYTQNQIKAFKSLEGYKYFKAGFIERLGVKKCGDYNVILSKVKHSQKMNIPSLDVWIICTNDGSVEFGHCTCMAGAGEACSHIAATLFALEFVEASKSNTACTDISCSWSTPGRARVECQPIKNIDYGRKVQYEHVNDSLVQRLEGDELLNFLRKAKDLGNNCALMRVIEPFATEGDVIEDNHNDLANPYQNLFNEEYVSLSYGQLLQLSENVQIALTNETCNAISEASKSQAQSDFWFEQRAGRITASKLRGVCHTSIKKPSLSVIKSICYPLKFRFKSKATEWGINNEEKALQAYQLEENPYHTDLKVKKVGLCLNPKYPYMGASPDGIVSCSCCPTRCIEVKCPYLLKSMSLHEYAQLKTSCLEVKETGLYLKISHAYFYQIQQQMAVTKHSCCDFVIWSPKEVFIERVLFDIEFWEEAQQKAHIFHQKVILPELLGQYFTNSKSNKYSKWCICNGPDDGRPMICCDNENCNIAWYHFDCMNINSLPELWTCPFCL